MADENLCCVQKIKWILAKNGYVPQSTKNRKKPVVNKPWCHKEIDALINMRNNGVSFKEISRVLGRDYSEVYERYRAIKRTTLVKATNK